MRQSSPWLRKSTGTWHVWLDGKQRYLGKDKKKAQEKFRKLAQTTATGDLTVRELVQAYWDWCKLNLAASTCKYREPILESFCQSIRPTTKADAIRSFHVNDWIAANSKRKAAVKDGKRGEKSATLKPLSPTTIGDYITLVKGVFNWGCRMGYLDTSPIANMPKPSPNVRQLYVPSDTWPKVIKLALDEPFRDYLTVMLSSGCRPQEMRQFEAQHLDGKRFVLPIGESKGRKRSRVVNLPDDALAIVGRLVKEYPTGPLFRNSKGNPWHKDAIRRRFIRLRRELDIPKLTATTLRHSFAHYRLTSGQDALTVSKMMGHKDTRMIATRYGHLEANAGYMNAAANAVSFPVSSEPSTGQPA
ncbi:tyrosine-type recombinase/integrase [Lacipirellula sp.]|uniref:tyrosine-type recombinase/integrase n=1 Tax=Lacipirellula sp. TaxID=2691419 RepID=UPI003D11319B